MAAEWVTPLITGSVTGTVGVVGVVFTYLTGRESRAAAARLAVQQREQAEDDRFRAEKREAYLAYLEATAVCTRARFAAGEDRVEGTLELGSARERLRLVAPLPVRRVVLMHFRHMLDSLSAAGRRGEDQDQDVTLPPPHKYDNALLAVMKSDLGYELTLVDQQALTAAEAERRAAIQPEDDLRTEGNR